MPVFRPTIMKGRLTMLQPAELSEMGIKGLLLDVDNTLATHFNQTPLEGIPEFLGKMSGFGIKLMIVSNARASRVEPFAEKLGLPFECLCKKPLPFGGMRAVRRMGLEKSEVLLCGDQLFTDILCGNVCGIKTLLLTPALMEDKLNFKIKRPLEKPLLRKYSRMKGK